MTPSGRTKVSDPTEESPYLFDFAYHPPFRALRKRRKQIASLGQVTPCYTVLISVVIGHLAASLFDALLSCAFILLVEISNTKGLNYYVVCELVCRLYLCIYVRDVLSCVLLRIPKVFEEMHKLMDKFSWTPISRFSNDKQLVL